jgi:hypothetical protein
MAVAAGLFFCAGILDGAYPGGIGWIDRGSFSYLSYVFGAINGIVAASIWRGSERGLILRIALAAIFFFERLASAFAGEPKSAPSVAVHLVTAFVELLVLLGALYVWRLGRSVDARNLEALFAVETPVGRAPPRSGIARAAAPRGARSEAALRISFVLGAAALALTVTLAADAIVAGFVPGGREWTLDTASAGWSAYLFAVVVALLGAWAVQGSGIALRVLLGASVLLFIERPFTIVQSGDSDALAIALHGLGSFFALAVAISAVAALRVERRERHASEYALGRRGP